MRNINVLDSRVNAVALPLMLVLCTLITYACFQTLSFLCIFPGLTVAIASGQLAGMLGRGISINTNKEGK